jgi:hypothetical protein
VGRRTLPHPRPLSRPRGRGVSAAADGVRAHSPRACALVPRPRDCAPTGASERPPEETSLSQLTSDSGRQALALARRTKQAHVIRLRRRLRRLRRLHREGEHESKKRVRPCVLHNLCNLRTSFGKSQARPTDCPSAHPADPEIRSCSQRFSAPGLALPRWRFVTRHPDGLLRFEIS